MSVWFKGFDSNGVMVFNAPFEIEDESLILQIMGDIKSTFGAVRVLIDVAL